jgi:CDP-diacylglycerol--glycerol-3-phosphate 3-phosphatidyltransferase
MLFVIGLAIMGSVMTSYTRARAECMIPSCKVGFFERPERIAMLALGAFLDRMPQALLIVAVFANLTGIHRIVYTWRVLSGTGRVSESAPVDAMSGGQSRGSYGVSGGTKGVGNE